MLVLAELLPLPGPPLLPEGSVVTAEAEDDPLLICDGFPGEADLMRKNWLWFSGLGLALPGALLVLLAKRRSCGDALGLEEQLNANELDVSSCPLDSLAEAGPDACSW